jgi:hypothetical protein
MHVPVEKDFQRTAIYSPDAHEMRMIPTLVVRIAPHSGLPALPQLICPSGKSVDHFSA